MPDAIITSTASTFGTISGTFAADQSTIVGTVAGSVVGTLTGSVGVPGPAGPAGIGLPAGGASGQFLQKTSGADYATDWVTVNLSGYVLKANNLSDLTDLATARDNLGLGTLSTPTFAGVNVPGSGTSVANLGATFLTLNQQGHGQFTIQPSQGIVFPDATVQTTAFTGAASTAWGSITGTLSSQTDLQTALNLKAPLASPVFTGDARAVTAALGDNDTSIATTAFVQQELLSGTANARNLEVYVRNQTGSTIPAGSIVYINGATGNRPTITLAQANNDANSAQTFGFVKTSIANNGFGFVIVRGELENIDTSALTEGVQLYLSPTTPGTWTTTKPSAPQHLVYVGICVRAHPTQGVVLVAVQNGYELEELHDVSIASKANNDLLAYESSTNLWKNKTFGALGLLTSSSLTGYATESWVTSQGYLTASALTGYATESWVTSQGYLTSSALTGYATESFVTSQGYLTDAPSDGNQYARKDGAWDVVSAGSSYITSVTLPLSVTSGDLSVDLNGYATEAWVYSQGYETTANAAATYLSIVDAATGYYPLTGNPSGFITSAALSTYAPLASPALTGNVTITTNSASPALFITQTGTGNILTLHDQASDTTFVAIDQNGKVNTIASTTANAGFNVPHGTAPTSPVNGDVWTTTSGLFMRQNGSTQQYVDFGGTQTISGAKTFSNANLSFGTSTAAGTINLGTGATVSGSTKTVNVGSGAVTGSTTFVNIGSNSGTSTTTLQGVTNSVTPALDSNTVQVATTQFVVGQAGSATPLVNGTAAVGTSLRYARQDHVHGTDTTRAPLASPTFTGTVTIPAGASISGYATTASLASYAPLASPSFTGTPSLPTGTTAVTQTAGNNTTAVATTAFVQAALPAAATVAEAKTGTDTAKFISSNVLQKVVNSPSYYKFPRGIMSTAVAGTGSFTQAGALQTFIVGPTSGAGGAQHRYVGPSSVDISSGTGWTVGTTYGINFAKKFRLTGSTRMLIGANNIIRAVYGKNGSQAVGDPTQASIGWRYNFAVGFIEIIAHNGTSLVTLTTASNPVPGFFEWELYNDGSGNVQMFVNDVSIGTLTGGPTGAFGNTSQSYVEEVQANSSNAAQSAAYFRNGGLFLQP